MATYYFVVKQDQEHKVSFDVKQFNNKTLAAAWASIMLGNPLVIFLSRAFSSERDAEYNLWKWMRRAEDGRQKAV